MRSLQSKIAFAYLFLAALVIGLSVVALFELVRIEGKVREGGKVAELFDATLEMRRFEKNYFLYRQPADLEDHAGFLAFASERAVRDAAVIDALAGTGAAGRLSRELGDYGAALKAYVAEPGDQMRAAAVRGYGNRIVTLGESLAQRERRSLDLALQNHRRNFLFFFAAVAAILVVTGFLLARLVTRPLQAMEEHMEAVARGQLMRLEPDSRDREFVSLTGAFNHVLDELERRQHTLVRSEKLASLGTLLSGVAHELNNPLSNISSTAQILREDPTIEPALREQMIADIDTETLRARHIVRALLDYAGDRDFDPRRVVLADLAEETLRFLKNKRPAGVEVRLAIPPALAVVADRPRLQQVLLNLVLNAYDAMGTTGVLSIAASQVKVGARDDDFPLPVGGCRADAEAVEIEVADSGPGIPPELLERIFDPFFTTKAVGHGSGLGLFIAYEIIEKHGGCMVADNGPGGGARFRIRLPADQEEHP
ncbi:MAG TPA: ATP-binding protein [Thiobacillaceae bacterium]|nr:ATP-binding protein [Thiobacillaceae bacterium]